MCVRKCNTICDLPQEDSSLKCWDRKYSGHKQWKTNTVSWGIFGQRPQWGCMSRRALLCRLCRSEETRNQTATGIPLYLVSPQNLNLSEAAGVSSKAGGRENTPSSSPSDTGLHPCLIGPIGDSTRGPWGRSPDPSLPLPEPGYRGRC